MQSLSNLEFEWATFWSLTQLTTELPSLAHCVRIELKLYFYWRKWLRSSHCTRIELNFYWRKWLGYQRTCLTEGKSWLLIYFAWFAQAWNLLSWAALTYSLCENWIFIEENNFGTKEPVLLREKEWAAALISIFCTGMKPSVLFISIACFYVSRTFVL